jgi:hypothetical protein
VVPFHRCACPQCSCILKLAHPKSLSIPSYVYVLFVNGRVFWPKVVGNFFLFSRPTYILDINDLARDLRKGLFRLSKLSRV